MNTGRAGGKLDRGREFSEPTFPQDVPTGPCTRRGNLAREITKQVHVVPQVLFLSHL